MNFEWDEQKNRRNQQQHKLNFKDVYYFDWDSALIAIDDRVDYGEVREVAYGYFQNRLTVVVFTELDEDLYRIISWRLATNHEKKYYEQFTY